MTEFFSRMLLLLLVEGEKSTPYRFIGQGRMQVEGNDRSPAPATWES